MTTRTLHHPAGTLAHDGLALDLPPETAQWDYASLRVVELPPGGSFVHHTGEEELVVLPLSGSCEVVCDDEVFRVAGRADVFSGVSDFVYVPIGANLYLTSEAGGRFALPGARARRRLPARHVAAIDVQVELRGAGQCSRQIVNFCSAEAFEADRLIAVEVLTPAGNWSSFPPHKHDEQREGETPLEEVYYFEVEDGPSRSGVAYQRVYGTADRPIDVLAEVRTGDVVLVPHGWHGPSMAMPGYDLYYLNVMAGPGDRAWRICEDPAHAWVRDTWAGHHVDPRLPLTRAERVQ